MDDREILDLIEHYRLGVMPQDGGGWHLVDLRDKQLTSTRGSLRQAVKEMIAAKAAAVRSEDR